MDTPRLNQTQAFYRNEDFMKNVELQLWKSEEGQEV